MVAVKKEQTKEGQEEQAEERFLKLESGAHILNFKSLKK